MRLKFWLPKALPLNLDPESRAALDLFCEGKHREGIDALNLAMTHVDSATASQYWAKGLMHEERGHVADTHLDRAMSYRLANEAFGEAVICDTRFLEHLGKSFYPETLWAIPAYPLLVTKFRSTFSRIVATLKRCTFAPEAALHALEDERFQDVAAQYPFRESYDQACETLRRLAESEGGSKGEDDESGGIDAKKFSAMIQRYDYNSTSMDAEDCLSGRWKHELNFPATILVERLVSGTLCERVRAACLLGFRRTRTVEAVEELCMGCRDRNVRLRTQSLVARARIARKTPGPQETDPTLEEDLLRAFQSDRSYLARAAATDALAILAPAIDRPRIGEIQKILIAAIPRAHDRVRLRILFARACYAGEVPEAIGEIDPTLEDELFQTLESPKHDLFRESAEALAKIGTRPDRIVPNLIRILTTSDGSQTTKLPILEVLGTYAQANDSALSAISSFEPRDEDEGAFIAKAAVLLRLSGEEQVVEECRRFLTDCQRMAIHADTRRMAIEALLDDRTNPAYAAGVLVERMFLDHSIEIRKEAQRLLIQLDNELAVRLDAFVEGQ